MTLSADELTWQRCEFTVRDPDGHVTLPSGQFTFEAVLDGQRRTWPLDLRDGPDMNAALRFSLR